MNINLTEGKNVFHILKKRVVKPQSIKEEITHSECRLGSLPYDLIKDFNEDEIPRVTQMVDKLFAQYGKSVKGIVSVHSYFEKLKHRLCTRELQKSLRQVLKRDDIDVGYYDSGCVKHCVKIKTDEYSYALSTFRDVPEIDLIDDIKPIHGSEYEPSAVFNLYKLSSHGRIAKPFMTRATFNGEGDEYIFSKFIEKTHSKKAKKGPISSSREKITHLDAANGWNSVNGIIIDVGGCKKNDRYIEDKGVNAAWQKMANHIDAYFDALGKYRGQECQGFLEQKMKEGVDILDGKNFEGLSKEFSDLYSERQIIKNAQSVGECVTVGLLMLTKKCPKFHGFVKDVMVPATNHVDVFGNKEPLDVYMEKCSKDARGRLKKILRQYRKIKEMKEELINEGSWDEMHSLLVEDFKQADFDFQEKPAFCKDYIPTMVMRLLDIKEINFSNFGIIHKIS